jgi:hypothetical protein
MLSGGGHIIKADQSLQSEKCSSVPNYLTTDTTGIASEYSIDFHQRLPIQAQLDTQPKYTQIRIAA